MEIAPVSSANSVAPMEPMAPPSTPELTPPSASSTQSFNNALSPMNGETTSANGISENGETTGTDIRDRGETDPSLTITEQVAGYDESGKPIFENVVSTNTEDSASQETGSDDSSFEYDDLSQPLHPDILLKGMPDENAPSFPIQGSFSSESASDTQGSFNQGGTGQVFQSDAPPDLRTEFVGEGEGDDGTAYQTTMDHGITARDMSYADATEMAQTNDYLTAKDKNIVK